MLRLNEYYYNFLTTRYSKIVESSPSSYSDGYCIARYPQHRSVKGNMKRKDFAAYTDPCCFGKRYERRMI